MDRVQYCKGGEEMKYDDAKTLAQIYMLREVGWDKPQLEATIISLLQHIYKDNEKAIIDFISQAKEMNS
jgi:hypothetical protein